MFVWLVAALVLAMIVCYIFLVGSLRSSGCCCYLRVGGCGLGFCGVILPFGGWVCVVVLGIGVVVLFGFSSGALAWFVWLTGSCLLSVWAVAGLLVGWWFGLRWGCALVLAAFLMLGVVYWFGGWGLGDAFVSFPCVSVLWLDADFLVL